MTECPRDGGTVISHPRSLCCWNSYKYIYIYHVEGRGNRLHPSLIIVKCDLAQGHRTIIINDGPETPPQTTTKAKKFSERSKLKTVQTVS